MNRLLITVFSALLLLLPYLAEASDPPSLFADSRSTRAQAINLSTLRSSYSFRSSVYFSKRHKLARINVDALESNEPLSIELFDEIVVVVQRQGIDGDKSALSRKWVGVITSPKSGIEKFITDGVTLADAARKQEAFHRITLRTSVYERNNRTGEVRNPLLPFTDEELGGIQAERITSVEGRFYVPGIVGEVFIQPLWEYPEYVLVMELDSSKVLPADTPAPDSDAGRRARNYERHLETLGPDPRRVAQERWQQRQLEKKREDQ